jgi:hypothetical protein
MEKTLALALFAVLIIRLVIYPLLNKAAEVLAVVHNAI